MGTMAKKEAFMVLVSYFVSFVCLSVSVCRREREWADSFDFYSMVSYFKGGEKGCLMTQDQEKSGGQHTALFACLGQILLCLSFW
ncbi:hypothetical protein GGI43DRAFT_394023 [Trichoderma evansii]